MKISVWKETDVMLKCNRCHAEIIIPANQTAERTDITLYTGGGWRYFLHNCKQPLDGRERIMEIYVKTKTGKWKLKSRSMRTGAISNKPKGSY